MSLPVIISNVNRFTRGENELAIIMKSWELERSPTRNTTICYANLNSGVSSIISIVLVTPGLDSISCILAASGLSMTAVNMKVVTGQCLL
ncbi:hypothetical protein PILCRDRAFT_810250 [Piloderma croceum F 1598]|uniref:Uncharacterized protein n=1 Tax=Piloderma croceum (strain F 1598) TaxID=765440 RepID=A0A0C3G7M0_PILCF|nr:hypothetical protein PILCRDRAFT_810250 [Piloderma croceum F 1598]